VRRQANWECLQTGDWPLTCAARPQCELLRRRGKLAVEAPDNGLLAPKPANNFTTVKDAASKG